MGIFDRFKDHARSKGKGMSDNAERDVNKRTGDKYTGQADDAQQRIEGATGLGGDRPERPDRPDQR
ncbi:MULTISPECIES: antitoxin [unclassified Streptomyces]|uniref:antitoxin n=1 Tax=unclassified Streptomyces TaxID=2593676 RepID=UPI0011CDF865|nr:MULTISPECIES: antitoxin [unclassified Streptomyces]TXS76513.1 antitoxin [Streptomyces sp. me109]